MGGRQAHGGQPTKAPKAKVKKNRAMNAFAIEFIGLAMVALCLVVLALPSGRRPSKHVRYE